MEIISLAVTKIENGHRAAARVAYAGGGEEDLWFETPAGYPPSSSGNPWLALLLPLAATLREGISMKLPVDIELLRGAENLLLLWKHWYPNLAVVPIDAPLQSRPAQPSGVASFFSAGVDSYFTVLRRPDAQYWITVQGFDMPVTANEAFARHRERLSRIASSHGKTAIFVRTNIRQTRWKEAHWEALAFGPALAATALLFENYFSEVLLPASCAADQLFPWGSHPVSDPLFSTTTTRIVHEGLYSRLDKIRFLAQYPEALRELHVCFRGRDGRGQDDSNCCRCEKCYRTMITLELLGALEACSLFDREQFDVRRIRDIFVTSDIDEGFFAEIRGFALQKNRPDIAREIATAVGRSRIIRRLQRLSRLRGLWRINTYVLPRLMRNALT